MCDTTDAVNDFHEAVGKLVRRVSELVRDEDDAEQAFALLQYIDGLGEKVSQTSQLMGAALYLTHKDRIDTMIEMQETAIDIANLPEAPGTGQGAA